MDIKESEKILNIFFSRKFHQSGKGKNPPKKEDARYSYFLERIHNKIQAENPIELILGFGYHKNLNICDDPRPDNAEKKSLSFLFSLAKTVKDVYCPGVMIHLITSGARAEFANGANPADTFVYHMGLKEMIAENFDFSKYIQIHKLKDIWDEYGINEKAKIRIDEVNISSINFEQLCIQAKRNIQNGTDDKIKESVVRFVASFDAEREIQIYEKKFPGAIIMSHRPNSLYGCPCLHIWTTKAGDLKQPWQKREMVENG
jgi:pyoverdine/dityrosine biosynthesis protein Dit1